MISEKRRQHLIQLGLSRRDSPQCIERGKQLGLSNVGRHLSEEQRQKISNSSKGRKAWNKGLTKEIHSSVARIAEANSGCIPWNKGRRNVYRQETLESMTVSQRLRRQEEGAFKTEDAVLLYQEGKGCKETARLLDSSYSSVQRRLGPLGLLRDKGSGNRGRKFETEHCKAISEGRKRLLSNPVIKERLLMAENNPFYGHKHKPETIEAMKLKVSKLMSGEGNPQWQGGKSFEPYSSYFKREARKQAYIRDNYQCQRCDIIHEGNHGELVAHHKDADKKNCNMENLITLCRPCHGKIIMRARWSKEVLKTQ